MSQITKEDSLWKTRQAEVAGAFIHAWNGYKTYAMGYDELEPMSRTGTNGLGGLGATAIDALDTAMIMGLEEIVDDAESWIKNELPHRLTTTGQVLQSPSPPTFFLLYLPSFKDL